MSRPSRATSTTPGSGATSSSPKTDAEAERIAVPAFKTQSEFRQAMRKKGVRGAGRVPQARGRCRRAQRDATCRAVGSPATVAEAIGEIDKIGVGGLILTFRIGPMPYEVAAHSIELFMRKVAPEFRRKALV